MATERTVAVRLQAKVDGYIAGMGKAAAATKALTGEIDSTNDRMAWMAQGLLAIGPTLAPIGASIVPVISGLATQMTIAGGAAGVLALGFNGIFDSLKALNAYQLAPTAANLAKVEDQFNQLGPAGVEFVTFLDDIGGKFEKLQLAAGEGMFPGMQEGIESAMTLLPQVTDIVDEFAGALGDLSAEAGKGLAGPKFEEFFTFIETNARPILEDMGHTIGNFIDGLAQMMVEFGPLSRDFSGGLADMSRDFADWAHGLDDNRSFQDFLAYIEQSIPKVQDFLGSLVDALVQITEAAAPVGDVALPVLSALLDIIAKIADTPIGSAAISVAALASAFGRLQALGSITTGGLFASLLGGGTKDDAVKKADKTAKATQGVANATAAVGTEAEKAGKKVAIFGRTVPGSLRTVANGAAGLAALTLAFSDIDDKAGLANTSMGLLAGAMTGNPWIAAATTIAGTAKDAAEGNNDLADSFDRISGSLQDTPGMLTANSDAIGQQQKALDDFAASVDRHDFTNMLNPAAWKNLVEEGLGDSDLQEAAANLDELQDAQDRNIETFRKLGSAIDGVPLDLYTHDLGDLEGVSARLQPAMDALGYSIGGVSGDLTKMDPSQLAIAAINMQKWMVAADTPKARMQSVGDAIRDLGKEAITTAQKADALQTALDGLLGTGLNAEQALDAFTTGLKGWKQALEGITVRSFEGDSPGALAAREWSRGIATDIENVLTTAAENGAGPKQLAVQLEDLRARFIAEGEAAGFSGKEIRARAREMGLTPKLVRTVFEAANIDESTRAAITLKDTYNLTPKQVDTLIKQTAMGKSKEDIKSLLESYGVTPKNIDTIIKLLGVAAAEKDLTHVTRPRTSTIGIVTQNGEKVEYLLNHLARDRTSTITINTTRGSFDAGSGGHSAPLTPAVATGGYIRGPGTTTSDSIPAWLSDKEFVVKAAAVDKYGVDFMQQINSMRFADGGYVNPYARPLPAAGPTNVSAAVSLSDRDLSRLASAVAQARPLYGDVHLSGDGAFEREVRRAKRSEAGGGVRF